MSLKGIFTSSSFTEVIFEESANNDGV